MVLANDNPKKQTIAWIFKAIVCFLQQHHIKTIMIGVKNRTPCAAVERPMA